ncbi:DUF2489 domain-containing protein [Comamonas testosteroni]|uniref:DUF2489 domain-containing protein n=1 Tax=Comamonas testosteroni TaxID=285 RepID=UPI00391B8498
MSVSVNPQEVKVTARNQLVQIVQAMLNNQCTFFEGAKTVFELRSQIGGVSESDPDFNAFVAIYSETDHLPYEAQRHLWSPDALAKLKPEYEKTELWAASFAPEACENLLKRFGGRDVT